MSPAPGYAPEMAGNPPEVQSRLAPFGRGIAICLGGSAAALLATAALEQPLGGVFFFVPLAAVFLVALFAGFGWALVAISLTWLGMEYLLIAPRGSWRIARFEDLLRLSGYAATALLMGWVASRVRASKDSERAALARMEALAASERRARDFLERLQRATASCGAAVTVEEVARAVFAQGLAQLGTAAVFIFTPDERGDLRVAFHHGIPDEYLSALPALGREASSPSPESARTRKPVFLSTPEDMDARYPSLAPLRRRFGLEALASLPLYAGGELQGVLTFGFDRPRSLDPEEREYVSLLAGEVAEAIARARSYEAEKEARREAERLGRVKERLLAIVGHDLRTPLSAILMGASAMRRGDLTAAQLTTLGRIERSAQRMNAIIHDLLDFTRFREGLAMPVTFAPVDAGEVARRTITEFEERLPPGLIELRVDGDVTLEGDAERLAQACSNLVGNAVQHGGGSPVRVEVAGSEDAVVLRVHNGGPAIDPHLVPELFEAFRKGDPRREAPAQTGSIGLGLFIVREIARAHGGGVDVRSTEEEGTTFTLRLPRRRPA